MGGHPTPASRELAVAFDAHQAYRGRAAGTRSKYQQALEPFLVWADDRPLGSITAGEIELYLSSWRADFEGRWGREPSVATTRNQITALKAFYDYLDRFSLLASSGGRAKNPMLHIGTPGAVKKTNDWLHAEEDAALLEADATPVERIIVWMLRWTGLRRGELCALRICDVHISPGAERIDVSKSKTASGIRTVPIPPELLPHIKSWLRDLAEEGQFKVHGPFLPTKNGTAMAPTQLGRTLKRVAARAGVRVVPCTCNGSRAHHERGCERSRSGENVSTVTPHTLRRTYASHLLNRGVRLEVVSKLLGHASTTVTEQAYAELLQPTIKNELFHTMGWAA
jgi:integrase